MIMNAARTSDMVLEKEDFHAALSYISEVERLMPSVFVAYGRLDTTVIFQRVMNTIRKRKEIWYSELAGLFINDLTQPELQDLLAILLDMNFLKMEKSVEISNDKGEMTGKTKLVYNSEYEVTG